MSGSNFSAGERQLLSFARALYHDTPILILDEATASVDSDTESKLQAALAVVLRERTSLVIAHRLSTIQAADRILVFPRAASSRAARIKSSWPWRVYARLHRLQFSGDAVPPPASVPSLPAIPAV